MLICFYPKSSHILMKLIQRRIFSIVRHTLFSHAIKVMWALMSKFVFIQNQFKFAFYLFESF